MMSFHFCMTIFVYQCQITSYYHCFSVFDWHIAQIDSQFHHQIRFAIFLFCLVHHVVFRMHFIIIHRDSIISIVSGICTSHVSRISSISPCFYSPDPEYSGVSLPLSFLPRCCESFDDLRLHAIEVILFRVLLSISRLIASLIVFPFSLISHSSSLEFLVCDSLF